MGNGLIVGEPGGGASARVAAIGEMLRAAGFDVTESHDVRRDLWYKLWGNMTMNPVSALTGATADRILADPLVRALQLPRDARGAGDRRARRLSDRRDPARTGTRSPPASVRSGRRCSRTSTPGGPVELDALLAAVREIGLRLGVQTPTIDDLLGLTRLAARVRGLYPDA